MGITCTWPCMALSEAKLSGPKYKVALDKLACLSLSNPAYLSSWLDALTTDHVRLKPHGIRFVTDRAICLALAG